MRVLLNLQSIYDIEHEYYDTITIYTILFTQLTNEYLRPPTAWGINVFAAPQACIQFLPNGRGWSCWSENIVARHTNIIEWTIGLCAELHSIFHRRSYQYDVSRLFHKGIPSVGRGGIPRGNTRSLGSSLFLFSYNYELAQKADLTQLTLKTFCKLNITQM